MDETTSLQVKQTRINTPSYSSVHIERHRKKYQREENCLKIWLACCLFLMASIIPIAEIIVLILYFNDKSPESQSILCPLQSQWSYFILSKLLFEIITIPLIIGYIIYKYYQIRDLKARDETDLAKGKEGQAMNKLKIMGIISFILLSIWNICITTELFSYTKDVSTYDASKCDFLIDFILFETVSVWAVIFIFICIGCWYYSHELLINCLSGIAHFMHNFVEKVTLSILYQWVMSVVEIVFLAIYYDGDCGLIYGQYIGGKFLFTVFIIGGNNFCKCCDKEWRQQLFLFIYMIGLIVWLVAVSITFWNDNSEITVKCRTNSYTSHYYDFILVDIILGYVVICQVMCSVCWIRLSNFLGSPKVVERYGEFAKSNTAEWIRYKESQQRR